MVRADPWYNPTLEPLRQRNRWACTLIATEWALRSLGVTTTVQYMADQLSAEGLYDQTDWRAFHDKSLRPLAEYLGRTFGFVGIHADAHVEAEWDFMIQEAGRWPIVGFGYRWFHSTGFRGYRIPEGKLLLANSADPQVAIPRQTIDRQEYEELGPWNVVVIRRK